MNSTLIRGAHMVNEGTVKEVDLLIEGESIRSISTAGTISSSGHQVIDGRGKHLLPGLIDDQVHFREPGLTHKADLTTESRAAAAGGITSYMEMPNTKPQTLTQELLEEKYARAAEVSRVNYSFFMGASNDNLEEVLKTDPKRVCGLKVFMGSSTGNMLVDSRETLNGIFSKCPMLIAVHCEDEATVRTNLAEYKERYGENIPMEAHPIIRSREACYKSSSLAVSLAKEHGSRLHVLHISSKEELDLFRNDIPSKNKRITSEACVHHLWFSDEEYRTKGSRIKWNPAVKSAEDREAIREAVKDGRIDVLATDHAPHTIEEKNGNYLNAPSGGPLVQHALPALLEMVHQGVWDIETVVDRACHKVAEIFDIKERGYLREGYKADMVLVDLNSPWTVSQDNILYKCGWSPFEGQTFNSEVLKTWVNGQLVYTDGKVNDDIRGQRLEFDR